MLFKLHTKQPCKSRDFEKSLKLHSGGFNNLLPAELPRVIHVGTSLDVAFVWVIDSGGSGVGSTQDEYKTV